MFLLRIAAFVLLASCAQPFTPTLRATRDIRPEDYPEILRLWTRIEQAFTGVEHRLTVKATMITPMLRAGTQKRFPEVYGYGGQVTRDELREAENEDTINFFVGAYTPNFRWNDFDKPDSIWRVSLQRIRESDGAVEAQVDARKIDRVKIDENLNTIYPYLTSFDQVYVMRFPAFHEPASTPFIQGRTRLRVRVASSFTTAELTWTIEP